VNIVIATTGRMAMSEASDPLVLQEMKVFTEKRSYILPKEVEK
jgi:hypothetical protein